MIHFQEGMTVTGSIDSISHLAGPQIQIPVVCTGIYRLSRLGLGSGTALLTQSHHKYKLMYIVRFVSATVPGMK